MNNLIKNPMAQAIIIVIIAALFGFILPNLISSKNTELVVFGIFIALLSLLIIINKINNK